MGMLEEPLTAPGSGSRNDKAVSVLAVVADDVVPAMMLSGRRDAATRTNESTSPAMRMRRSASANARQRTNTSQREASAAITAGSSLLAADVISVAKEMARAQSDDIVPLGSAAAVVHMRSASTRRVARQEALLGHVEITCAKSEDANGDVVREEAAQTWSAMIASAISTAPLLLLPRLLPLSPSLHLASPSNSSRPRETTVASHLALRRSSTAVGDPGQRDAVERSVVMTTARAAASASSNVSARSRISAFLVR